MRLICACIQVVRQASTRFGDGGAVVDERVTVVLEPVYSMDPAHPNRAIWTRGVALGQVRLAELPPGVAAPFELHKLYSVEVTALKEEG